jgi:hypothetical protein
METLFEPMAAKHWTYWSDQCKLRAKQGLTYVSYAWSCQSANSGM